MRLRRNVLAPLIAVAVTSLTACTPPAARTAIRTESISTHAHQPNPKPKPTLAAERRAFHRFILGLQLRAYLDAIWQFTHVPYDWYAIADCETGRDWNVTGSLYSTGLGMMNEAIRENSPPDVAARELTGTATILEIVGTARTIATRHGIHSWGCGRKLYP